MSWKIVFKRVQRINYKNHNISIKLIWINSVANKGAYATRSPTRKTPYRYDTVAIQFRSGSSIRIYLYGSHKKCSALTPIKWNCNSFTVSLKNCHVSFFFFLLIENNTEKICYATRKYVYHSLNYLIIRAEILIQCNVVIAKRITMVVTSYFIISLCPLKYCYHSDMEFSVHATTPSFYIGIFWTVIFLLFLNFYIFANVV